MAPPSSATVQPGALIAGRYRVERILARGGHGAVYQAEQLATEAKVALKVLLPHVLASEEARTRFALESRIAGRVGSEFIVRVLDAGVDEATDLPFLAMELLQGQSLADAVQEHGPMSPLDAASCLMQVAQGLDRAHGHRSKEGKPTPIIHRDLKPENLFLTIREDGQHITKILDFGLAKIVSESVATSREINGSPLYMAYEQLLAAPLSPATDVWALGLIAFFLLTGKTYWRAGISPTAGISAIFAEILHMPIVAPSQRARDLGLNAAWPPAFDAWFLRCVHRDPKARFASAGAAARALLDALLEEETNEAESSPPPSPLEPSPTRTRKRAARFAGLAIIGFGCAALGYAAFGRNQPEPVAAHGTDLPNRAVRAPAAPAVLPAAAPAAQDGVQPASPAPPSVLPIAVKPKLKRAHQPAAASGAASAPASVLDSPVYSER